MRYETTLDLLQDPENTITDVASLPGYSDPSHFSRAFRRIAGISPGEYLQQHKDRAWERGPDIFIEFKQ